MDVFIPGNVFLVDVDILCHGFLCRKAVSVVHRKGMELMAMHGVVNNEKKKTCHNICLSISNLGALINIFYMSQQFPWRMNRRGITEP